MQTRFLETHKNITVMNKIVYGTVPHTYYYIPIIFVIILMMSN